MPNNYKSTKPPEEPPPTSLVTMLSPQQTQQQQRPPLLDEAARTNSEAIDCFSTTGDYDQAREMIKFALQELKRRAREENFGNALYDSFLSSTRSYNDTAMIMNTGNVCSSTNHTVPVFWNARSGQQIQQQQDMVQYEKAFLCQGDIPYDAPSTSAILLYNTGLLCHQEAFVSNRSDLFEEAISMYERSIDMIKAKEMMQPKTSITLLMVLAAALHNLAHCKVTAFMDRIYASDCQQALASLLNDISFNGRFVPVGYVQDFDFFWTSIMTVDHRIHAHRVAPTA